MVTEATTGFCIGSGRTPAHAKFRAQRIIEKRGGHAAFAARIAKTLAVFDPTPFPEARP
jgi:hypothetical protein